jgi:class 3 adenylate cyclase/Tfp pilus assembly protein PilF
MKSNPQMDHVLEQGSIDAGFLNKILPTFQTFAHYGDVKPYLHYQSKIDTVCKLWEATHPLAIIIPKLTESYIYFCLGENDKVESTISSLKKHSNLKIDGDHQAIAEMMLGICKRSKGDIDEGLIHFLNINKALQEDTLLPNFRTYADYFIAEVHMQIDDVDTAGHYYKKALANAENGSHKIALFRSMIGLGTWHLRQKEYQKCFLLFDRAFKMKSISEASRARVMRDIGTYYLELEEYNEAIEWFEKSYDLASKDGYNNAASTSLIYLANVYLEISKPDKSLLLLKDALEISLDHMTRGKQLEIETLLAHAYEATNKYKKAYEHLEKASKLKELINTNKQREIFKIKNRLISEQAREIEKERDRSNNLLLNILPESIASELKDHNAVQPKSYDQVTVMFTDFIGFTSISESLTPEELVKTLDTYFCAIDKIILKYGLEKIKTIGDAYMCAGGLPEPRSTHAADVVKAGLEIQSYVDQLNKDSKVRDSEKWRLRIGVHSGPVIAGVVGNAKFAYDIWGDTVNTASRMESYGAEGKVNVSEYTYKLLRDNADFKFTSRGKIKTKGKGDIKMYFAALI